MFRGKESSNRIEISQLVQDLYGFWCFGLPAALGWMGLYGGWGMPHTHVHMYEHVCTHTHAHIHIKHDNFICKWLPPLGESLGIPYDVIHVHTYTCMYVHACACVYGVPSQNPTTPSHTPHPLMGPPRISQNSITLELIKIYQFCLKI